MIKTKHWRFGGQFLYTYDMPKGERPESAKRDYFHQEGDTQRPALCLEEIDICRRFELWEDGKLSRIIESRPATEADLAPEKNISELEGTKDVLNTICSFCGKGKYIETRIEDDWEGTLHCSSCRVQVRRHQPIAD